MTAGTHDGGPTVGPMQDASADGSRTEGGSTQADASSFAVPGPAATAGFNTLVFEDDFTTNDTIAPTQSAASGYKWYWSFATVAPGWTVDTSATAANIANGGNSGGRRQRQPVRRYPHGDRPDPRPRGQRWPEWPKARSPFPGGR